MIEHPSISVIVPVYNGERYLQRCLDALFSSSCSDFEVIVVDDMSTDKSIEISQSKGAQVLSSGRKQSGPANARNLAADTANGEILLFVDADVVVKPDTLTKVANAFYEDPEIAALFGSYDDDPAEGNFLSQYKNLQHHFVHQMSDSNASTFWAGLGAVRRDVFLSVGGFDCEQFLVPSIEDIELGMRLRSAGHRILLAKEIQAKHLKKWEIFSLLRTEVFCRAIPWSRLILTRRGMINDMNLKTSDRLSAVLVAILVAVFPFVFLIPTIVILEIALMLTLLYLNRHIFGFFLGRRGLMFALMTYPWQLLYFFYSGLCFVACWFRYRTPELLPGLSVRERE